MTYARHHTDITTTRDGTSKVFLGRLNLTSFSFDQRTQTLTTVENQEHANPIPARFKLIRDLPIEPYGIIAAGAVCNARETFDGLLELDFVERWTALRQWDNILRLFPDCVDSPILDALQALPESPATRVVHQLSVAATVAALIFDKASELFCSVFS